MVAYQLRLAWNSLRRNPVLSVLMIAGIGLGMAVAMTIVTAYYHVAGNPIRWKSDRLHYVQLDGWSPDRPFSASHPDEPPFTLTYRDAIGAMKSDIPVLQTASYPLYLTVYPPGEKSRPGRREARGCFADFFEMFDVPFQYGSGWSRESDRRPEPAVVISRGLNDRFFGGENSVGRSIRIEDREFRIVGVRDHWRPMPKFYDIFQDAFSDSEEIYLPFGFGREWRMTPAGSTYGWKDAPEGYEGFLDSEHCWVTLWVQLDTSQQEEAYRSFLEAYIQEQKKLGRFARPMNYRLRNVQELIDYAGVLPEGANAMLINALLFLLICAVNLIGILLGKFLGRAPEVGVRRALGASRRWVFAQHLLECQVIALLGGAIGLGLSVAGLRLLDRLYEENLGFYLDWKMFLTALALSVLSAMVAGLYPAWRICRIQPALHLKAQ